MEVIYIPLKVRESVRRKTGSVCDSLCWTSLTVTSREVAQSTACANNPTFRGFEPWLLKWKRQNPVAWALDVLVGVYLKDRLEGYLLFSTNNNRWRHSSIQTRKDLSALLFKYWNLTETLLTNYLADLLIFLCLFEKHKFGRQNYLFWDEQ